MRFTNYLKLLNEGWTIKPHTSIRNAYNFRWGGGSVVILYIYFKDTKNLYWKAENSNVIYLNKKRLKDKGFVGTEHSDLVEIAIEHGEELSNQWRYGKELVHGLIVKNKIYPYENEESPLSNAAFRAIYEYIDDEWWTKK